MPRSMPMVEARKRLTALPEELENAPDSAVMVTRRGKPVLAVLSWDLYESLVETLEILGDANLMKALRKGIRDAAAGRVVTWTKAKRRLGW